MAWSQNTSSPFDLVPRLNLEQQKIVEETTAPTSTGNPFDIVVPNQEQTTPNPIREVVLPDDVAPEESQNRFLFGSLVVMLILLVVAFSLFRYHIRLVLQAFSNDNMLRQIHRDQGTFIQSPYLFLYLVFFFNAGFFEFLLSQHFRWQLPSSSNWENLLMFVGATTLLFFAKHILLRLIEWIFPFHKEVRAFSFTIIIFSITLGFILIPINLFLAFGPPASHAAFIYVALFMIGGVYLFRSLRGLLLG
ncbi:MAG: DUF4271 domain-containing protein, partial [Bacteroidota bacterium]